MAERLDLIGSKLIGELGLLDDPPSFQRREDGLGEIVGKGTRGEEFGEVTFVGSLCEVVGITE